MTTRLYAQGFIVQPLVVMADDESETCAAVKIPPCQVESVADLVHWAEIRWPKDFGTLKAELVSQEEPPLSPPPEDGSVTLPLRSPSKEHRP